MQRHRIRPTHVYATVNRGIHAHLFRVYKNVLYGSTLGGVRHRFLELRAQSGAPERTHTLVRAMSTATTGPAACARPAASTRTLLAIPSNSPMRRAGPRRRDDGAGTPRATVACEAAAHPQPAPAGATKPSAGCAAMAHTLSTHPTTRTPAIGTRTRIIGGLKPCRTARRDPALMGCPQCAAPPQRMVWHIRPR